jgi:hypothetical protein
MPAPLVEDQVAQRLLRFQRPPFQIHLAPPRKEHGQRDRRRRGGERYSSPPVFHRPNSSAACRSWPRSSATSETTPGVDAGHQPVRVLALVVPQSKGGRKKFRFKNKLMSLDGSIIDLSVSMFDWAKYRRSTLAALLRQQLFFYRDLWAWLDDPFQAPPALVGVHDDAQQLEITW